MILLQMILLSIFTIDMRTHQVQSCRINNGRNISQPLLGRYESLWKGVPAWEGRLGETFSSEKFPPRLAFNP
jgi:hypothetical protein